VVQKPVVVVEVVDTPEQAVEAANRTLYGLTSSILAGDTYRAFELAPKVLAGIVNINSPTVNDEIHAPMGGVRHSGWGRTGPDSLKEFQDVIWINSHSGQRPYPFRTLARATYGRYSMSSLTESTQVLLDHAASGRLAAYDFLVAMSAAGLSGGPSPEAVHEARTANEAQTRNQFRPKRAYDYIVIGSVLPALPLPANSPRLALTSR
jgi:hypothetical protein